ncbi:hypothetical protein ACF0H5_022343 [Mactra antiquata]
MSRKQSWGSLTFTLPVVILLALINIYLLMYMHSHNGETTVILTEKVYNKNSDSSSSYVQANKEMKNNRRSGDGESDRTNPIIHKSGAQKHSDDDGHRSPEVNPAHDGNDVTEYVVSVDNLVDEMIETLRTTTLKKSKSSVFPSYFWNMTMGKLTHHLGYYQRSRAKTLAGYDDIKTSGPLPAWKLVHRNIRQFSLYSPDDPNVDQLLKDMATLPITEADENDGGTQLKINTRLSDGGRAVLKPMRYGREVEADENRYIFDDIERHIAEIAAFQLDRVLGFYRVPPTIGRLVNITSELKPIVPKSIHQTMFTSPAGNLCFYGECDYYCDSAFAFCGRPDVIEVSMMSYLPSRNIAGRKSWYQPWRRSYNKRRKAYWEEHDDLCDKVRHESPYNNGKILLDMIDAHTFDFLTGNKDRHSFATFREFGNFTFPIMYDNGRGFGRRTYDAMSILAPLDQCCLIRKSTFLKYVKLYMGPEKLSYLMKEALKSDPIAPVLIRGHLTALDRRIVKILHAVAVCLQKKSVNEVIVDDRF